MRNWFYIAFVLSFTFATLYSEQSKGSEPSPDRVMQKVLEDYGVKTRILRSYASLRDGYASSGSGYILELSGSPSIRINLDRDHWVLAAIGANTSYMLNPKDEQSALNISIGEGKRHRSDKDLSRDPGFGGISTSKGSVAGVPVVWREWSDEHHIYSDCIVDLQQITRNPDENRKVIVNVTANSSERRDVLKRAMDTLEFLQPRSSKPE